MFRKDTDFKAFERVMVETHLRQPFAFYRIVFCAITGTMAESWRRHHAPVAPVAPFRYRPGRCSISAGCCIWCRCCASRT